MRITWLLGLFLLGCGSSHGGGGGGGPPVAREDFCNRLGEEICEARMRCGCGVIPPDCAVSFAAECQSDFFDAEIVAALDAGLLEYNASAGGRLVAGFSREAICDEFLGALGWRARDIIGFGGILTGTREPGESCTVSGDFISECRLGICSMGRCIGLVDSGETCDALHACIDLDRPITGTDIDDAVVQLRCEVPPGSATGTCVALRADGEACVDGDECASQVCDVTCRPPGADGAMCTGSSRECVSGFCNSETSTCAAGDAPLGAACVSSDECESDACDGSVCVRAICND